MRKKKERKNTGKRWREVRNKFTLISISLILLIIETIVFVLSQNQSLQEELTGLEQNLSDSGYNWLINQSINYSEVESSITENKVLGGRDFEWGI